MDSVNSSALRTERTKQRDGTKNERTFSSGRKLNTREILNASVNHVMTAAIA
jgi:hypothetical protein